PRRVGRRGGDDVGLARRGGLRVGWAPERVVPPAISRGARNARALRPRHDALGARPPVPGTPPGTVRFHAAARARAGGAAPGTRTTRRRRARAASKAPRRHEPREPAIAAPPGGPAAPRRQRVDRSRRAALLRRQEPARARAPRQREDLIGRAGPKRDPYPAP